MSVTDIISSLYAEQPELKKILLTHSQAVADMALECADRNRLPIDRDFTVEAALLHDIGIIYTHAPSILCFGTEPYIRHGIIGYDLLMQRGLPRHAAVCATHTGAGLTAADIVAGNLPLPHRDFLPETLEEKLICYADKFYSKSGDLTLRKPLEKVRAQMASHGPDVLTRFEALHTLFALPG